jgi:L,D-transpeptidase catalytic domain
MIRFVVALIITILLAGNIYFYMQSKNKPVPQKLLASSAPVTAATTTTAAPSLFTYITPNFEIAAEMIKIKNTRLQLKNYAIKNKCNLQYVFIADMHIPSYKKRFFVYDLKKDSLLTAGFVAHGTGSETFRGQLVFSNVPDSRCTSLGKYKIGTSYKGIYGFSYRLQGLDSTNNNAMARSIVLHGNSCVPDTETDDYPICFSYGCAMVSANFLQQLKFYISKQGKTPILFSIIY